MLRKLVARVKSTRALIGNRQPLRQRFEGRIAERPLQVVRGVEIGRLELKRGFVKFAGLQEMILGLEEWFFLVSAGEL
jgi:hypothetical protein